ncbi:MAG: FYVE zinc finger domain-containing protein [bacterium]
MNAIRRSFKFEVLAKQNNCNECGANFSNFFGGLFSNKHFCEFCMNYVCTNCLQVWTNN